MRRCHCLQWFLAMVAFTLWVPGAFAQSGSAVESGPGAEASRKPELSGAGVRRFRLEARGFDNIVSNDFGHWVGTGLNLSYQQSDRLAVSGGMISQWRPGETERLFAFGALVNWSEWFYTNLELSGGGPDNPAAFFPQLRYDATANLKIPSLPGLILTGGLTRLYFGSPVNGRVSRAGAIYYWRDFVFQGSLNFNNVRPGNRKSKSVSGAVQYGREGSYWAGLAAGGGREAWQTLALTPQEVEFSSYSYSVFLRKWLNPSYGIAAAYSYSLKRTAYQINGLEMKFFLDF